ncbi:MAG: Ig-like domain-containing protein [Alphaproteobacteria bacterium]|nr:Ig-like domain-containing protein [Alphaproteobacteria bacterium]
MTLTPTRLSALALAGILSACTGGTDKDTVDTDTDSGTDTEDTSTCKSGVNKVSPKDKAPDAFVRQRFAVTFKADEKATATFKIVAGDSTETDVKNVTWDDSGKNVYFDPASDLAPTTAYTLKITYSCGEFTSTFTTSDVGTPLADANTLKDVPYVLDLSTLNVIEPAGVGGILSGLLSDLGGQTIAIVANEVDTGANTLKFYGGLIEATITDGAVTAATQPCEATFAFDQAVTFDNPFFEFSGNELALSVAGFTVTLGSINLSGAFNPAGDKMVGVTLAGDIDVRDLGDVLGELVDGGDPQAACDLLVTFGVSCTACSDNQNFCLSLVATDITAYAATDLDMKEITEADVTNECKPPAM